MQNTPEIGLLQISGEDAKKFLQGQLTCNIDDITDESKQLCAHCNPQGRIISLFHLFTHDNAYYLQMPRNLVPIAQKNLQKYAVFFKTKLTDVSDTYQELNITLLNLDKQAAIANGIPAIYPETSERFLPHDLNLPNLNAVSFTKGCYTGQEIIARMQYRGKPKNHLYQALVKTPIKITNGNPIYSGENTEICGNIVDYWQSSTDTYELLVVAPENAVTSQTLYIDPEKKNCLEFFNL